MIFTGSGFKFWRKTWPQSCYYVLSEIDFKVKKMKKQLDLFQSYNGKNNKRVPDMETPMEFSIGKVLSSQLLQ